MSGSREPRGTSSALLEASERPGAALGYAFGADAEPTGWWRSPGWTAALVLFVLVYLTLGLFTELQLIARKPLPGTLFEDFGFYLRALADATNGRDPYAIRNIGPAFLYPPPALFVVWPFAQIGDVLLRAAAFLAVNLVLLGAIVWGVARAFGYRLNRVWWWLPLAFGFGPVLETLHLGQMNLVTEFGSFLVFFFDGDWPALAGFGFALGTLTKVTAVVLVGYLMVGRSWRALKAAIVWTIALLVASAVAFGPNHLFTYVDVLSGLSRLVLPGDGNTQGLLSVLNYDHVISLGAAQADVGALDVLHLAMFGYCVVLGYVFRQSAEVFVGLSLLALLSPNLIWYHHWAFLILPLLVWMGATGLQPLVVGWCLFGLTLIQLDRWILTEGLLAETFVIATLYVVLVGQGIDAWQRRRSPRIRSDLSDTIVALHRLARMIVGSAGPPAIAPAPTTNSSQPMMSVMNASEPIASVMNASEPMAVLETKPSTSTVPATEPERGASSGFDAEQVNGRVPTDGRDVAGPSQGADGQVPSDGRDDADSFHAGGEDRDETGIDQISASGAISVFRRLLDRGEALLWQGRENERLDDRLTVRIGPPNEGIAVPGIQAVIESPLVIAAIALGEILRLHGALVGGQVADVAAYRNHVELLRLGQSVYQQAQVYPYFPGWLEIEWLSWLLSTAVHVEFWIVIRMVIVVADLLTCFALWWAASRYFGGSRGRWVAVIYALNPIAILISGYHGQFDALPTLLAIVAAGLLAQPIRAGFSGVLLGLAVAVKPSPALLGPIFLRAPNLSTRQRILFAGASGLAFFAVVLALAGNQTVDAFVNVLGYGGVPDQGITGLFRALWMWRSGSANLPGAFPALMMRDTRVFSLATIALVAVLTWNRGIARASAAVLLAFLATYGGVSTQYLLWPVAWLLLGELPLVWTVIYSLGVSAGAIGFYRVFWPELILGAGASGGPTFASDYLIGEIIALVVILATLVATVGRPRGLGQTGLAIVGIFSFVALVTAIPVIQQCLWLAGEVVKYHS